MPDDSYCTRGNAHHRLELPDLDMVDSHVSGNQIAVYKDFLRQPGFIAV